MLKFNDSPQAALSYLLSQTSHIESEAWKVKYPDITYAQLIPVDTTAHPWAKSVTYFAMDGVGKADWINGNSRDVPLVGLTREKFETEVHMAAIGYDYTLEELNQAAMLGRPLTGEKASYARRAYEEHVENVAFNGDATKGFSGFINNGTVTRVDAPNGAGGTATWATKTPDEILKDFNDALAGVWIGTKTVALADTVLLPLAQYSLIATKRLGTDSETTILAYIEANNIYTKVTGQKLTIRAMRQLSTAGSGGTARMIVYRRSPEVLKMHIPMPLQFLAAQQVMFRFIVPGMFRIGGVDIRLPSEVRYVDAI